MMMVLLQMVMVEMGWMVMKKLTIIKNDDNPPTSSERRASGSKPTSNEHSNIPISRFQYRDIPIFRYSDVAIPILPYSDLPIFADLFRVSCEREQTTSNK